MSVLAADLHSAPSTMSAAAKETFIAVAAVTSNVSTVSTLQFTKGRYRFGLGLGR